MKIKHSLIYLLFSIIFACLSIWLISINPKVSMTIILSLLSFLASLFYAFLSGVKFKEDFSYEEEEDEE